MGKITKAPFSENGERASELLELVYTDVYRPILLKPKEGIPILLPLQMIYLDLDMCIS